MTSTRSLRIYPIQSSGSGPGHSDHKFNRQECQPRGEAQMEDSRASNSSQRDIPVSVQELVYGRKEAVLGTPAKSLDRHNELISSSEEIHVPTNNSGPAEGFETHALQRTSPKDKSLVEKP
ncbi:hypothetical protein O181_045874 [Austropuccinia psidii MF-1]|uniref:Uncharacterized protein n=1 Tax=Austropuccinia psidii MF-1 TaxID=1389203 RepID=A0A9Q3DN11_9BASI|nr:hypothetical protein [Austropuccinia psidii MF-1]